MSKIWGELWEWIKKYLSLPLLVGFLSGILFMLMYTDQTLTLGSLPIHIGSGWQIKNQLDATARIYIKEEFSAIQNHERILSCYEGLVREYAELADYYDEICRLIPSSSVCAIYDSKLLDKARASLKQDPSLPKDWNWSCEKFHMQFSRL